MKRAPIFLILFCFLISSDSFDGTFEGENLASSRRRASTSEARSDPIRSTTLAAVFRTITRAEVIFGKPRVRTRSKISKIREEAKEKAKQGSFEGLTSYQECCNETDEDQQRSLPSDGGSYSRGCRNDQMGVDTEGKRRERSQQRPNGIE